MNIFIKSLVAVGLFFSMPLLGMELTEDRPDQDLNEESNSSCQLTDLDKQFFATITDEHFSDEERIAALAKLHKEGARVNIHRMPDLKTPLTVAISRGDVATTKFLLSLKEINVHLSDFHLGESLHYCAQESNETFLQLLLENKAQYDPSLDLNVYPSALHMALSLKNFKTAKLMCQEAEIDPNITDAVYNTPLHNLADHNPHSKTECELIIEHMHLLADRGVNINCKNKFQRTAFDVVYRNLQNNYLWSENLSIAFALLALGATIKPEQMEFIQERIPSMTLELPENRHSKGLLLNCVKESLDGGQTRFPTIKQHLAGARELGLKYFGLTPLMWAAARGHDSLLDLLLAEPKMANFINQRDNFGNSALHYAARNNHSKTVALLLSKGAAITKNNTGCTPLHLAACNGHLETVNTLLSKDFAIVQNDKGETPLTLAQLRDHDDVIEQLNKYTRWYKSWLKAIFSSNRKDFRKKLPVLPLDITKLIIKYQAVDFSKSDRQDILKVIQLCQQR